MADNTDRFNVQPVKTTSSQDVVPEVEQDTPEVFDVVNQERGDQFEASEPEVKTTRFKKVKFLTLLNFLF